MTTPKTNRKRNGNATLTPNADVTTPGKEDPVVPTGAATPARAPSPRLAAVLAALAASQELAAGLTPNLGATSRAKSAGRLAGDRERYLPVLTALLRAYPDLAPAVDPDKLADEVALAANLRDLAAVLRALLTQIDGAEATAVHTAWTAGREIYAVAQVRAASVPHIGEVIAPLTASLAFGPRTRSKGSPARAAKAGKRAQAAQHRADVAKFDATVADAAAQVHAGAVPTVTVTPPAPPAPPTHT